MQTNPHLCGYAACLLTLYLLFSISAVFIYEFIDLKSFCLSTCWTKSVSILDCTFLISFAISCDSVNECTTFQYYHPRVTQDLFFVA